MIPYTLNGRIKKHKLSGISAVLPVLISCRRIARICAILRQVEAIPHLERKSRKNWLLTVREMRSTPSSPANCPISRTADPGKGVGIGQVDGSASVGTGLPFYRPLPPAYLDPPEFSDHHPHYAWGEWPMS